LPFKEAQKRLKLWVRTFVLTKYGTHASISGEQGKVDESMREMAAIEALKSEKADKEVCTIIYICGDLLLMGASSAGIATTH